MEPDDPPRALLRRLMAEHRWNATALSRAIERGPTYVRDYLDRRRPPEMQEREREAIAAKFPGIKPDQFRSSRKIDPAVNRSDTIHSPYSEADNKPPEESRTMVTAQVHLLTITVAKILERLDALEAKAAEDRDHSHRPPKRGA